MIDSYISPTVCGPGLFRCDDGKCISDSYRCDNYRDCSDGGDEINCGKLYRGSYMCAPLVADIEDLT